MTFVISVIVGNSATALMLGDKEYLSAEVRKNLSETANITIEVPYRLNQRQSDDDTKLREAILRTFHAYGG